MRVSVIKVKESLTWAYDTRLDILKYDADNKYPQNIIDILNGSGTAKKCIEKLSNFVAGDGFEDTNLDSVQANETETLRALTNKIADSLSKFNGVALHCNYSVLGQITDISVIPFEYVRRCVDSTTQRPIGKFAVYDDWNNKKYRRLKQEEIDYINEYNVDSVKEEISKVGINNYKGQILYFTFDNCVYPLASIDSVLEDCITDAKIKTFKFRNITTSFMPSAIVVRQRIEDDAEYNQWIKTLKDFQGSDEAGKIMSVEVSDNEVKPEILPFNSNTTDKAWEYTERSVKENIREALGVPQILATGSGAGKLGSSTEMNDAYNFVNNLTENQRNMISQLYAKLFVNFITPIVSDFKINAKKHLYYADNNGGSQVN